ncbi:MAG: hypothetical protein JWQ09_2801 [Segetibacter sp.]|nr:hypothetical protein [Segetibacter sp.]
MENNNKILHELEDISPLLTQFENKTPYSVSSSYFSTLSDRIAEKIKSGEELTWYFTRENPYFTPAGYFETLPAIIVQKIEKEESKSDVFEEMEEISPLLNTISKKPVYTVPDGYLAKAEWNKSETTVKKAKVVSFTTSKRAFNYAAAAVIIALLTIGMFLFTGKENTTSQADNVKAASEVKKLSEQEIIDFLKTASPTENIVSVTNSANTNDNDIKSSVSKMTDKEIQEFLQENGEQDEM